MKKVALITLVWVAMAVIVIGIIIFNQLLNQEQAPMVSVEKEEVKEDKIIVNDFLQQKADQIAYNKANPKTFTKSKGNPIPIY